MLAWGQLLLNSGLFLVGLWWAAAGLGLALIISFVVPLIFIPFSYSRMRLHQHLEKRATGRPLLLICILGLVLDSIMAMQLLLARSSVDNQLLSAPGVAWVGAVWFSAHAILLLGYGLFDLARAGSRPLRRRLSTRRSPVDATGRPLGRREFLQQAGLLSVASPFVVSASGVATSYDFRVEHRDVSLPNWPTALDGLRIVHLSDIHVGGMMDGAKLRQVAELVNSAAPDLVLHTGDFLTHREGSFAAPLFDALKQLQPPHGQWACLGNHDFEDPSGFTKKLRECGVTVLRDRMQTVQIEGSPVELGGFDFCFDRPLRRQIYANIIRSWTARSEVPRILLNHDPLGFRDLPDDCADLVLSGHTHGGHVGLQFGSQHALTLVGLAGIPDQGFFSRGAMWMYVTRCVGFYGYPMRIGIPPEIAVLTVRRSVANAPSV